MDNLKCNFFESYVLYKINTLTDKKILNEIRINPHKFEIVYNAHYESIFNYCYRRTNNFDASYDITAEAFLKAYLNIRKFRWKGIPIKSWLYRIATNELKIYYRSKQYKPKLFSEIPHDSKDFTSIETLLIEKNNAQLEMEKYEQFRQVQKAITKLPLKYQEVITLKYFENLKLKEISVVLNKKEGTIKSLLSRAIEKLKGSL